MVKIRQGVEEQRNGSIAGTAATEVVVCRHAAIEEEYPKPC